MKPLRCSEIERRLNCAGSLAAESGLPELPPRPEAESGRRIHAALHGHFAGSGKKVGALDERERRLAKQFIEKIDALTSSAGLYREKIYCEKKITRGILSGTPDMVIVRDDGVRLICDYKTGWKPQIGSERNMQLRGYAVLVAAKHQVKRSILCALLEPDKPISATEYTAEECRAALAEITEIARRCNDPKALRIPGSPQCDYCRAAGNPDRCPESLAFQSANLPAIIPARLTPALAAEYVRIWDVAQVFKRNLKPLMRGLKT